MQSIPRYEWEQRCCLSISILSVELSIIWVWKWFNNALLTEFLRVKEGVDFCGWPAAPTCITSHILFFFLRVREFTKWSQGKKVLFSFTYQLLKELLQFEREVSGCSIHCDQLSDNTCGLSHFWGISKQILLLWLLGSIDQVHLLLPTGRDGHPESAWVIRVNVFDVLPIWLHFILCIYPNFFSFPQSCLSTWVPALILKARRKCPC